MRILDEKESGIVLRNFSEGGLFDPPRVIINYDDMQKIQAFVGLLRGEIRGWGFVDRVGNDFLIHGIKIVEQDVSSAHAEDDIFALAQMVAESDYHLKMKFQWHSHGQGGVYFSPEDIAAIRSYASDYMISAVFNRAGEYRCRIDLYNPFYICLEVPLLVVVPIKWGIVDSCRQEILRKVRPEPSFAEKIPWFGKLIKRKPIETESFIGSSVVVPLERLTIEGDE